MIGLISCRQKYPEDPFAMAMRTVRDAPLDGFEQEVVWQ
jgi:hypothetical protein